MFRRAWFCIAALSLLGCGAPPAATPGALTIPDEERPRHQHRHCHPASDGRHCHVHHHGPGHHTHD